ncbi:ATP-binding cassette domain-containing protein [Synechococcales cyanobacterium C]|uniref:ATP-binding cassette domain-containing protein n=1 Tax=Petrachloros mirabilis ULC683 TaxID=2781853 RepID=A0A8K2AN86_9CYAN|nr:ABC transporter ATP-binding protein [Petrachloros mirabilis]NCJ04953.1 ATP-binding cassette domain-containing protein [Petrachloros mirabilis ULC683]
MIEVEHLSKVYGSTTAIEDVTFQVEPGEILGLLGPNGAGKTTTMRILAGYLPATQGTARVNGFEVHENPMAVRQRIGYLPETPPLYLDMTVEGYLHFVARLKGVSAGDREQRVQTVLQECNLLEKRTSLIHKLSKGFRQRVGIAQAIVHDPPAIILDEPTVGLDPRQIIDVRHLIKKLAGNKTVILSTHILPEVSMTCNRVAIINQGHVVGTGSLTDLMTQLAGVSSYELLLQGDQSRIAQQLLNLSGIQSLHWHDLEDASNPRLSLRVVCDPGTELGPKIAATLVHEGAYIYEIRPTVTNLEDVFLQLTTEEQTSIEGDVISDLEGSSSAAEGADQEENSDGKEPL